VGLSFAQKFEEANKEKNLALALMLEDEKGFDEFLKAVEESLILEKNRS
tara:strand:+ start:443 stop:589 length:147 start_codon:yes stop_codon:yes gene_type:complete